MKSLSGKRTHFTTDGTPEVGVNYLPVDIVGLDLDAEEQGDETVEPKVLEPDQVGDTGIPVAPPVAESDPTKRQKIWIGEVYVQIGVPLMFYDWKESLLDAGKGARSKTAAERRKKQLATRTG